jgi:hypothetical protein
VTSDASIMILITAATGQVGREAVDQLVDNGDLIRHIFLQCWHIQVRDNVLMSANAVLVRLLAIRAARASLRPMHLLDAGRPTG